MSATGNGGLDADAVVGDVMDKVSVRGMMVRGEMDAVESLSVVVLVSVEAGGVVGVVMYCAAELEMLCQVRITSRYWTVASAMLLAELLLSEDGVLFFSVPSTSGPAKIRTFAIGSSVLARMESRYVTIVLTSSESWPSIAMMAPRTAKAGLVGEGLPNAGVILERTLILLRNGMVRTIASTDCLFCWERGWVWMGGRVRLPSWADWAGR